jgi:3-oxoadipate enol-lactonase
VAKQDILTPVKFAQELAAAIPQAELVVMERGGHGVLIESSDAVISQLRPFLASL